MYVYVLVQEITKDLSFFLSSERYYVILSSGSAFEARGGLASVIVLCCYSGLTCFLSSALLGADIVGVLLCIRRLE